jgi:hypothetical protein
MLRHSIWPAVLVAAGVMVIALVGARTMCSNGPSKTQIAEKVVADAAQARFPAWRASHRGCPRFAGELLDEPVDPWSHAYRVVCSGDRVVVTSAGADGRFGTADDISARGGAR